mgnify:CR=1 FL=1
MKFLPWVFLVLGPTADAVVVASGGVNNTAPAGQPYFANVGPGGIYLGDGWVLTAAHVAGSLPATASFGGLSYATEPGSFGHRALPSELASSAAGHGNFLNDADGRERGDDDR